MNYNELKTFEQQSYSTVGVTSYFDDENQDYQSPPFNPGTTSPTGSKSPLSTTILIIDAKTGNPIVNANVAPAGVTNQNGEITINATSQNQIFTISYVGYRTHKAAFKDLVNAMISLQPGVNLPPVIVKPKPTPSPQPPTQQQKANKTLLYGALGAAAIFAIAAFGSKPKNKKSKRKVVTV